VLIFASSSSPQPIATNRCILANHTVAQSSKRFTDEAVIEGRDGMGVPLEREMECRFACSESRLVFRLAKAIGFINPLTFYSLE